MPKLGHYDDSWATTRESSTTEGALSNAQGIGRQGYQNWVGQYECTLHGTCGPQAKSPGHNSATTKNVEGVYSWAVEGLVSYSARGMAASNNSGYGQGN